MTVADLALHSFESALEAWAACEPNGYMLPEAAVDPLLAQIACLVPESGSSPCTAEMLMEMFLPAQSETGVPVFQQMLKPRDGVIHFLYFWRAFSKATYVLSSKKSNVVLSNFEQKGIGMELETVRDEVLRLLELAPDSRSVKNSGLSEILSRTISISIASEFWSSAVATLKHIEEDISLHQVTALFISWLHEAIAWQHREVSQPLLFRAGGLPAPVQVQAASQRRTLPAPFLAQSEHNTKADGNSGRARRRSLSIGGLASKRRAVNCTKTSRELALQGCMPVYLHIYDVSQENSVRRLNKVLAHRRAPIKFGGVFHAGVEVNGLEFAFGMSESAAVSGITCTLPRSHPQHRYRQTVRLRPTALSDMELGALISELIEEYPGHDYDLLRRNCCHFADDFCRRLGVGGIPGWVHRLARVGAMVDNAMHAVTRRRLLSDDVEGAV